MAGMQPVDRLESLGRDECLQLLAAGKIGRFGFVVDGQPRIEPVNYRLIDGDLVLVSRPGAKLDAAVRGDRVALEIDAVEEWAHAGWSVLAVGTAAVVSDAEELARHAGETPEAWAPVPDHAFIRIAVDEVTGRRVRVGAGDISTLRQEPEQPRPEW